MLLYHATYRCFLDTIMEDGLLVNPPERNWSWSNEYAANQGFGSAIFLANSYELAESFAETADHVSDDVFDSGIVVLEIDSNDLDLNYLSYDPFFHNNIEAEFEDPYFEYIDVLDQVQCFAYQKDIPAFVINIADPNY